MPASCVGGETMAESDEWKDQELKLRQKEVRRQGWGIVTQLLAGVGTLATVAVAAYVANQGEQAYKAATQVSMQQAQDNGLSTALNSLGSSDVAERVAGMVLLEENAADRLSPTSVAVFGRQSAYAHYGDVLEIFSGYLHSHGSQYLTAAGQAGAAFGLGYGLQPATGFSLDLQYAVDQVTALLSLKDQVFALHWRRTPAIDLSSDELYAANLTGTNFSWLKAAYMVGIDLRGAYMERVQLSSGDDLADSFLQCADLQGAHLQGVNLRGADLRGANLSDLNLRGADLRGANLEGAIVDGTNFAGAKKTGAILTGMYGTAKGLPSDILTSLVQPPNRSSCLANPKYWHEPTTSPTPVTATASPKSTPSRSPKPTPTATLRKPRRP